MSLEQLSPPAADASPAQVSTTAVNLPPVAPRGPFLQRVWRAFAGEFSGLHPRIWLIDLLVALLPYHAFPRLRAQLYRLMGFSIGRGTLILGRLQLGGHGPIAKRLRIGSDCVLNAPLFLDLTGTITIGDHVHVGHHTVLVTADHEIGSPARRGGEVSPKPIVIDDGCLIGAAVTVLPGVRISQHSIVTPSSLVAASVPASKLVGGVPARTIKSLPEAT
jgi:acetyltransferase-like isoleucine patch superfamily enzyme